jgi:hypothetical protein
MALRLAGMVLCLLSLGVGALQAQGRRSFRDSRFGVFLEYPALWSTRPDPEPDPAPAILADASPRLHPLLRVGFGSGDRAFRPYRGSTLEGVEFIAVVVEGDSAETCRQRLAISGFRSGFATENGVSYGWTMRTEESAGRTTAQKVYAAFRQRRCYLFEEDVHEALVPGDGGHTLTDDERGTVNHDLETIMASVLYLEGLAK